MCELSFESVIFLISVSVTIINVCVCLGVEFLNGVLGSALTPADVMTP